MTPMTPPIVVSSDDRPPITLRRSDTIQTWEDEVREVSRARIRLQSDDETDSRDIDFRQSKLEDLEAYVDSATERRKLAEYLPSKIAFEARNQCFDALRRGQDGDIAYEQALHLLDSQLNDGSEHWRLPRIECLLELGDVEAARELLTDFQQESPVRHNLATRIVGKLQEAVGLRGRKRSLRGEATYLEPRDRPQARRRRSTVSDATTSHDAQYEKMVQLNLCRERLDLALRAEQWDEVKRTQAELHGIDPGYFDIKSDMNRFDKIRQLLHIGSICEQEAKTSDDPARRRQSLEEALRTYNHGCYATELFNQRFSKSHATVYDHDHVDCANLFFSASRVCISFHINEDLTDRKGRRITPRDCKMEPSLAETSWMQQALYFMEQGRSRALLDSIARGEEYVPRLQRNLLDNAIDSVVWAAQASIQIKKRDSLLFPGTPPASPPSQAVSPSSESPPESFRLFHSDTASLGNRTRSNSPSPAFMRAVEQSRRRNTFDQSTERPKLLGSQPSSPILAGESRGPSFTEDQMRRIRVHMRWRRVKLHLFSEVNPTFNAAVAALPNAGKGRFRELNIPVPEGVVIIEYGLPSSSPNGLVTLVVTSKGVQSAQWRDLSYTSFKRIKNCIRELRSKMEDEYALVRREAPSPKSPKSVRSVSDVGDSTIQELRNELFDHLIRPIETILRVNVPERVIIVPSGELAHVPWSMLIDYPFSIVPSLTIWHRLHHRSPILPVQEPKVSIFSNKPKDDEGTSRNIPYSRIEALYLSWLHQKRPALADDVDRKMFQEQFSASLEILHLCAHSNFDTSDPLKSSVKLFKEPWSITQWRDLSIKAHIVVFSSCLSAISQAYDSGSSFSFAHALLATGTRAFVGSLWPVEDEPTLLLMMLFYEGLRKPLAPDQALYQVSFIPH